MKNKSSILYIITIILSFSYILIGFYLFDDPVNISAAGEFFTAKVTEVGETELDEFSFDGGASKISNTNTHFKAKITDGYMRNEIVDATQYIDFIYFSQPKAIEKGDIIILAYAPFAEGGYGWQFIEHNRSFYLVWLCVLFFGIILAIGQRKGVATILSLVFTAGGIFLVYIPAVLKGYNIYLLTTVTALYIILMSLCIINGINQKTLCAVVGNALGVAAAGILAIIMNNILGITGVLDESYVFLVSLDFVTLDLRAIVWSAIVIGSLGAIMDVAMTIASAMHELSENMDDKTFKKLLTSGMNIGKDAIGTMTNTLILAYIGSSLAMVLLRIAYNQDILYMLNLELIAVEVLQALVGSMGILLAVPVTATFAAFLYTKKPVPHEEKQV